MGMFDEVLCNHELFGSQPKIYEGNASSWRLADQPEGAASAFGTLLRHQ